MLIVSQNLEVCNYKSKTVQILKILNYIPKMTSKVIFSIAYTWAMIGSVFSVAAIINSYTIKSPIDFEFPSVGHLIKLVSFVPHLHCVQVHASTLFTSRNVPFNLYSSCFPCTFVFSEDINHNTLVEPIITRYTQLNNIIIVHNGTNKIFNLSLRTTWKFSLLLNTVYFIYHRFQVQMRKFYRLQPATKILIRKAKVNSRIHEMVCIDCEGYCNFAPQILSFNFLTRAINPPALHKSLLWNGNGRLVYAFGIGGKVYLERFKGRDQFICRKYVGTGLFIAISALCDSDLLSVLYLAGIHNISIKLLNYYNSPEDKEIIMNNKQFVFSYGMKSGDEKLGVGSLSAHAESGSAHWSLAYCTIHAGLSNDGYKLWTEAFQWYAWLLLITIILLIGIVYWRLQTLHVLQVVSLALGQGVSIKSRTIICFVIFTYFVRTFFENTLTSVILVPPKPKEYESLRELILDKVKIIFHREVWSKTAPEEAFASDFRQNGVGSAINKSFVKLRKYPGHEVFVNKYLRQQRGTRYASLMEGNSAAPNAYLYTMIMMQEAGNTDISCHLLKQRLNPRFKYFVFNIMNRKWLMITLQRMRESGLTQQWDKWAEQLKFLGVKIYFRSIENLYAQKFQVVVFKHFISVFLLMIGIFCTSLIVFLLHLISTHYSPCRCP